MKKSSNSPKKVKVSCPTRADLAGGTLDLWPLFCLFDKSKTINIGLPIFAHVEMQISKAKEFTLAFEAKDPARANFKFPEHVVRSFFGEKKPPVQLEVKIATEAPIGSGLGGSSTLCVALAKSLNKLFPTFKNDPWDLLNWVKDVEAGFLKTPTGTQDYLGAIFEDLTCFEFKLGKIVATPYPPAVTKELKKRMLVIFSGEMHHSGLSNWEVYKAAIEQKPAVINGFQSLVQIVNALDLELRKKEIDWAYVGSLLSEEWIARRNTFNVHTEKLDQLMSFLKTQDILGAKVCGAANGGSLLVLVDPKKREALSKALKAKNIEVLV